jgi:hypothetical protein
MPKPYDRAAAVAYARQWAMERNPVYATFDHLGGDCTNFVSQCVYAGCGVMNFTPDMGWYYTSLSHRSAPWSGVPYLNLFLTRNAGAGPYASCPSQDPLAQVQPGDIIQLNLDGRRFEHSVFVVDAGPEGKPPTPDTIRVCAHSEDSLDRPLSSYTYHAFRVLHVEGARE